MIKYKLICKDCDFEFDSWFGSSNEYDKLKKRNFLDCFKCNSKKIEKTLMAPMLINKSIVKNSDKNTFKFKEINKKIKKYQNFIKKNFDYVGKNFAYEARAIHYNDKKKEKGIYGSASNDEMKQLKDEGIDISIVPWIEDKNN